MKTIKLTQGQVTIVDDSDYEWLNQWKWYARWNDHTCSFYAVRQAPTVNGHRSTVWMHREILGLKSGDKHQGDHWNHDTLNNTRGNLRVVSHQENCWNHKGTIGYRWDHIRHKYEARIYVNRKGIYLGLYKTPHEARVAHLSAKAILHKIAPPETAIRTESGSSPGAIVARPPLSAASPGESSPSRPACA